MISRVAYLKKLIEFRDKKVIKVITGIRRCGKSVLLQQFRDQLISSGVDPKKIILMNFESLQYENIENYKIFYDHIRNQIQQGRYYLLLDEIQVVDRWEKAIASFQVDFDCDIYITGSNAFLLSSDLATFISGRYVEIHIFPLSFKETLSIQRDDPQLLFRDYIKYGGFPGLVEFEKREDLAKEYLDGIYNTVVVKDILSRNNFQNISLLNLILKFMIDNVGNLVSANNIADYLSSNGQKTHVDTVLNYLEAFEKAFILYKADRYNLKGKRILRSPQKFYIVDSGIRNAILGFRDLDIGRVLENIVYLELKRRGFDVRVGVDDQFEIDFIATKDDEKLYIQTALSLADEKVKNREFQGLLSIKDNYRKILLSMDFHISEEIEGISFQNIIDFLLN
ncbi:MAG: ATPase [Chloroflexi bacterium GWB2_49_20]|nr:MAG: ATPase [Chloroflexi bacterium GWB2_49_20]OGN77203.1 MAG: ATPase [Chloroflexi bacterium GWC2_49_37]OGN83929.1 MAG: ATPase [Chloroflexi bacterium GWD2_49_16]